MKCPTDKRKYHTKRKAEEGLMWAIKNYTGEGDKLPRRTYECELCGYWHLTSQSLKKKEPDEHIQDKTKTN